MAPASSYSLSLLAELRRSIAERGIERPEDGGESEAFIAPAKVSAALAASSERALPAVPLAVAADVYGTLLASAVGGIGPGAPSDDFWNVFPHDMAERLHMLVAADHERKRAEGIPWPEVDAALIFSQALGLDYEDGARASVAWECTVNRCAAMPGAARFLTACVENGLALGMVSNAQFYTPLFVEEAFGAYLYGDRREAARDECEGPTLRSCLGFDPELSLWSYRTGRAKPDRWMFDELARRLAVRGVPADRILFVGNDALNDCAAAGEAGLMTALFCGDARSCLPRTGDPRVIAHPPTTMVSSWDDLRRLLCI